MTSSAAKRKPTPRHEVQVESGLRDWIERHSGAGGAFYNNSHALNVAMLRPLDEYDFVEAQCKARHIPFQPDRYWLIHAEQLAATRPNERGNPHSRTVRTVDKLWGYLDAELMARVRVHAEPDGPFASSNPVSHAIDFGFLRLRAAEVEGAVAGARFPLDGVALMAKYQSLAKTKNR
ncbi:MAG TPA: hypothetical protein VM327_06940 [Candidatus Thermoplasmatota archaeon]|nr:hypothetical protein [Candidatus Thermoplasmatota archaeon]